MPIFTFFKCLELGGDTPDARMLSSEQWHYGSNESGEWTIVTNPCLIIWVGRMHSIFKIYWQNVRKPLPAIRGKRRVFPYRKPLRSCDEIPCRVDLGQAFSKDREDYRWRLFLDRVRLKACGNHSQLPEDIGKRGE